jgi:hypothetical protein
MDQISDKKSVLIIVNIKIFSEKDKSFDALTQCEEKVKYPGLVHSNKTCIIMISPFNKLCHPSFLDKAPYSRQEAIKSRNFCNFTLRQNLRQNFLGVDASTQETKNNRNETKRSA